MRYENMIPHAGAMNQQQDMALKPLFTTAELAKSALLERLSCPNCHALFEIDYADVNPNSITNHTQLKEKCSCSRNWRTGEYFCPCCSLKYAKPGPVETHFWKEHSKYTRLDTWHNNKAALYAKSTACPLCLKIVPFSELLPHVQLDFRQFLHDYTSNFDLAWFRTCGNSSVSPNPTNIASTAEINFSQPQNPQIVQHNSILADVPEILPFQSSNLNIAQQNQNSSVSEFLNVPSFEDQNSLENINNGADNDVIAQDLDMNNMQDPPSEQGSPSYIPQADDENDPNIVLDVPDMGDLEPEQHSAEHANLPVNANESTIAQSQMDRLESLGISDDLNHLSDNCTFNADILKLNEMKTLKEAIDESNNFKHTFQYKIPRLDFSSISSNLKGDDLEFFKMYHKTSDSAARKTSALFVKRLQKANPSDRFEHTYNWYIKTKDKLKEKSLWKTIRKETVVGICERIQKILSSQGDILQLEQSDNTLDFTNSECYKRMLEYCRNLKDENGNPIANVYPLAFLFWKDDFEEFSYGQINTVSQGGLSYRILNFPFQYLQLPEATFLYAVAKPKIQDIVTDVVTQFNMLFRGIEFDKVKFVPFLSINLSDNPERYKFLKRNWWNSKKFPCSHCSIMPKYLPFESNCRFNNDATYLVQLFKFLPFFIVYVPERDKMLQDSSNSMSVPQIREYIIHHQRFETKIEEFRQNCGYRFVQSTPVPPEKQKFFKRLIKTKALPHIPMHTHSLDIVPFLYLNSYWKGFFPLFHSIPMEPFHTLFNIMKATVTYLHDYQLLSESKFKAFLSDVNSNKNEKVKFSENHIQWHGDQYIVLMKESALWVKFCSCIKEIERMKIMKFGILLSFVRNCSPAQLKFYHIEEKLRELQMFQLSGDYETFVQKKITSHQIIHLLQNSSFLGYMGNFDGQNNEKKHKKTGRNGARLFLGGDISHQIVNFETIRENIKLMKIGENESGPTVAIRSVSSSSLEAHAASPALFSNLPQNVNGGSSASGLLSSNSVANHPVPNDFSRQWIGSRKVSSTTYKGFDFDGWLTLLRLYWPLTSPPQLLAND